MNSDLNSAQNSHCTRSGSVHCAHTAQVAHMSLAQPTQVARSTCASRGIGPRSWAQVATSFPRPSPGQVATSFPGRDLLDDQARSQCQSHVATSYPPNQSNQVTTSKWGRDTKYQQARSRPQNGVATPMASVSSCEAKTGRPHRNAWLRPQAQPSQVATSLRLPPQKRLCHDPKPWS